MSNTELYAGYSELARKEVFGIEDEVCVLDVETTGISAIYERIIEIGIARMRGPEIIAQYNTYINPGKSIPRTITELTGITNADIADAPTFEEVAADILDFIGDCDIIAHNANFDQGFVQVALARAGEQTGGKTLTGKWLDSLTFVRLGMPRLQSFKLEDMMRAYCPQQYAQAHRAIADVLGLCHIWRMSLVGISKLERDVLRALPGMLKGAPEHDWIARVAQLYAGDVGSGAVRLKNLRYRLIKGNMPETLEDARLMPSLNTPAEDTVTADLSESGLAGHMYENFEARDEQSHMATAIARGFSDKTHLAVEAGTGVGKSLAYLVPLARLAIENNISVGVATKTNALTDQLMRKELPLLAKALAEQDQQPKGQAKLEGQSGSQTNEQQDLAQTTSQDRSADQSADQPPLRFAALKGYSHYPCLRKISSFLNSELTADADAGAGDKKGSTQFALATAQLIAWISQTAWGELSSINLPLAYRDRKHFAANSADCLRRRCTYFHQCYIQGARRRAKGSHIVVTNHSLLFRNSAADGNILPPIRYWAVDEAHGLEAEARKQLAISFDQNELDALLKQMSGSRGLPRRAAKVISGQLEKSASKELSDHADKLQLEIKELTTLTESFFAFILDLDSHESVQESTGFARHENMPKTHWIGPQMRDSAAWGMMTAVGTNVLQQLKKTLSSAKAFAEICAEKSADQQPSTELGDLLGAIGTMGEYVHALDLVLAEPEENAVYSLYIGRPYQGVRKAALEIAQLEVGEQIASEFLEQSDSVIFASATLAVGDSFKRFTTGVGLGDLPDDKWKTLQLASSYDLPNLMRILVPADLPEPRAHNWSDQFIDFLLQVHQRTQGGVLTLYTSRRDLIAARDILQDDLRPQGIDVLAQDGMLSVRVLQERFIADRNASLLATKSFWEGFDASGDTLRCIVIPKLPFGRPDTPLARERAHVYGRSAWARFDLPETILELKQAVGRLVRTSTDSGIVILADSRVLHKNYGKRVLDSLPVAAEVFSQKELLAQMKDAGIRSKDLS